MTDPRRSTMTVGHTVTLILPGGRQAQRGVPHLPRPKPPTSVGGPVSLLLPLRLPIQQQLHHLGQGAKRPSVILRSPSLEGRRRISRSGRARLGALTPFPVRLPLQQQLHHPGHGAKRPMLDSSPLPAVQNETGRSLSGTGPCCHVDSSKAEKAPNPRARSRRLQSAVQLAYSSPCACRSSSSSTTLVMALNVRC